MRCTYDTTGRTGLTYVSSWGTCLTDSHFKPDMIFFFFNLSIHSFTHCRWEFVFFVLFFLLHYVFFKYVINIRTVYSDNYFNLAGWWINNWRNVSKFSSVLPQASWWKCSHFLFQHSQSGKFSEWVCNLCYYVRLYYTKSNFVNMATYSHAVNKKMWKLISYQPAHLVHEKIPMSYMRINKKGPHLMI